MKVGVVYIFSKTLGEFKNRGLSLIFYISCQALNKYIIFFLILFWTCVFKQLG